MHVNLLNMCFNLYKVDKKIRRNRCLCAHNDYAICFMFFQWCIHVLRVLTRLFGGTAAPPFTQFTPPIKINPHHHLFMAQHKLINPLFTLSYIVLNTSSPNKF